MKNNSTTSNFQQAVIEAGITPPQRVKIDGNIHRFPTNEKPGDTAGWYVLNDQGIAITGAFGCWRSGVTETWSSIDEAALDKSQLRMVRDEMRRAQKLADQEKIELQEKASMKTAEAWSKAQDADSNHQYLVRKGVNAYGIKQFYFDGFQCLMIPLMDTEGKLWSYQRIYPDDRVNNKFFLKNGRVTGLFHTIGEPTPTRIIAEGYATAASLHESTGHCVHVAFNSHNLQQVAESIRRVHSDVELIIAADDDWKAEGNPGLTYATKAAQASGAKLSIPTWQVNNRKEKDTDFNDLYLIEGPQAVKNCIDRAERTEKDSISTPGRKSNRKNLNFNKDDDKSSSQATNLVMLAEARCELFTDHNGEAHTRFSLEDHIETYRISSSMFRDWLAKQFWETESKVPGESAMSSAITTLNGIAKFNNDQRKVFQRVGKLEDKYYLDLADEQWRTIEISDSGWRVLEKPPVIFVRTSSMRSLPEPKETGDLDLLWNYINIPKEDRFLLLAWILECFRRNTPDPILELTGEQGSGKSLTHNNIRDLIDPNKVNLRSVPEKREDLFVPAGHSLIVSLENVSRLSPSMQDALCSLSTGGGFAARGLYTNDEEFVLKLQRPVIINGIAGVVTRADLLDRTLSLELPRLEERQSSSTLCEAFERDRPAILSALLDIFVEVINYLPSIKISPKKLPRMGDFAQIGEAIYQIKGYKSGKFLFDYKMNRERGIRQTLDSSPVGQAIQSFMECSSFSRFDGTIKQLLKELESFKPDQEGWVKTPRGLGDTLRRLGPALSSVNIDVKIDSKPQRDGYHVHLNWIESEDEDE